MAKLGEGPPGALPRTRADCTAETAAQRVALFEQGITAPQKGSTRLTNASPLAGDNRWIVKDREDGANCNNWHWTSKNVSSHVNSSLSDAVKHGDVFPTDERRERRREAERRAERQGERDVCGKWRVRRSEARGARRGERGEKAEAEGRGQ